MRLIASMLLLVIGVSSIAQEGEFGKTDNGLIYSDVTVKQLRYIVDSLNLKFKVCDLNKKYLSKKQSKAHYVFLEGAKVKEAKRDFEANIPFGDFEKKFGKAVVEKELLVVRFNYKDYFKNDVVEFSSVELNNKFGHDIEFKKDLRRYDNPLKGTWVYSYNEKSEYTPESIEAFYFIEDFSQKPLPDAYARMVQYSECMVDTSAQIFYDKAKESGVRFSRDENSKVNEFVSYVHKVIKRPEYGNEDDYDTYAQQYQLWESLRIARVDSLKANDRKFGELFEEAIKEVNKKGGGGDEFEEYVGRYQSKKAELELKRNRRVIGGCSMDNSPRVHALNIAILSAETVNWEIFLRSHLDIMNDRFDRVSDGSYAYGARKTYIKELEVLDINVLDLLLGISLRIENPSSNHYYGSIGRLGRALSETSKANEIENVMLGMISDSEIDDYNRLLIYYLYLNYSFNLENKEVQSLNMEKLMTTVKTMPGYLATKLSVAD